MGLQSGIHVYGYRKPTIYASLVAGGSLAPNTTYYIVGMMKMAPITYNAIASAMSNLIQITTTATDLSIQLSHKTFRDITAFADNGDNRTLITCPRHCLGDGVMSRDADQFKIDTGSYAGTWTVDEWVNYDQFIIDTPYIDNVAVQCYTDGQYYNRPVGIKMNYYNYQGVAYYINTSSPFDTDGSWKGSDNRWSDTAYTGNNVSNPVTITAAVTNSIRSGNVQSTLIDRGMFAFLRDWGPVMIQVSSGNPSISNLYDEVQSSGFTYSMAWQPLGSGYSRNKHIMVYGCIILDNGATFSTSNAMIIMICGEFNSKNSNDDIVLNNCGVIIYPGQFTGYGQMTLSDGLYWNAAGSNGIGGHIKGTDTYIWGVERFGATVGDYQISVTNVITSEILTRGVIENKVYESNDDSQIAQLSYGGPFFRNCKFYQYVYWVINPGTEGQEYDAYCMENVTFVSPQTYIFRIYSYTGTSLGTYDFLNINTNTVNNEKRCIRNNNNTVEMRFWRRAEFYVQVNGTPIENAYITIVDGDGNQYSGYTDEFGRLDLDVLEQVTSWLDEDPLPTYTYDPAYQTDYSNYTITVYKEGYNIEVSFFETLYEYEAQNVTLTAIANDPYAGGLTEAQQSQSMRHLFLNEPVPEIGDASGLQPSAVDGYFYIALFVSDPGEQGSIDNELSYPSYTRIAVPRDTDNWKEYKGKINNVNAILFSDNDGPQVTITHYGIMKQASGSDFVGRGNVGSGFVIATGQRPQFLPMAIECKLD